MDITPSEKIAIVIEAKRQKTSSGLIIPTLEEKAKPEMGEVVAFGPGDKPVDFVVGDTIFYRRYMDNKIFYKDRHYNFIKFEDIVGVIKENS